MVRLFDYQELIMVKRKLSLLLVITLLTLCACSPFSHSVLTTEKIGESLDTAQFHFIDVGQGDCTLITSGETSILIDCSVLFANIGDIGSHVSLFKYIYHSFKEIR